MSEEKLSIEIIADKAIAISKVEYDILRRKANVFDILEADIRMKVDEGEAGYSLIDDDLILLLTGMKAYQLEKRRAEEVENVAAQAGEAPGEDEAGE